MEITREHLEEQYQHFLKDETNLKLIQKQGITWFDPGFIVELFVADFHKLSGLTVPEGFYTRYTPVARVLSASPHNEGPKAEIKAGDLVFMGDNLSHIVKNPEWDMWYDARRSPQLTTKEPLKYVRKVFDWISRGKLFYPDRAFALTRGTPLQMDTESMKTFAGPYVFHVDTMDVKFKIENPWG